MEKQMIAKGLEDLSSVLYYGRDLKLDFLIEKLQMYRDMHIENGYSDIEIDFCKYEWDDDMEISLSGKRLETDEEYEARVKTEERKREIEEDAKKRKLDSELQEYMRLKRKFEGGGQ